MIDEKKLVERLWEQHKGIKANAECYTDVEEVADEICNVVSIIEEQQKVGEWILVSERLPNKDEYLKNDGRFIVTDGNRVYQSIYDPYSAHCFRTLVVYEYGSRGNYKIDKQVIAWMPLQEPYKE